MKKRIISHFIIYQSPQCRLCTIFAVPDLFCRILFDFVVFARFHSITIVNCFCCDKKLKCVKYKQDQGTHAYPKTQEEPTKCANCNMEHPASYRGFLVHKNYVHSLRARRLAVCACSSSCPFSLAK